MPTVQSRHLQGKLVPQHLLVHDGAAGLKANQVGGLGLQHNFDLHLLPWIHDARVWAHIVSSWGRGLHLKVHSCTQDHRASERLSWDLLDAEEPGCRADRRAYEIKHEGGPMGDDKQQGRESGRAVANLWCSHWRWSASLGLERGTGCPAVRCSRREDALARRGLTATREAPRPQGRAPS
eukprot:SAG31_NODE_1223_length_9288_cov_8.411253_1_plen_180_part_00